MIRWSAPKVSEAMDMVEDLVNQAAVPLEQARIVAEEARKITNLPQYIDDRLNRIIGEIDRAIGGTRVDPEGRLKAGIKGVRDAIPKGALEGDRARPALF